MKHESWRRRGVRVLGALVLTAWWALPAAAQEASPAGAGPSPPAAAAAREAPAKKSRGRLPAYYGKVVTDEQREQIYEIQARFTEQITKLQEQLDALVAKRDAEIDQVLTDEQRAKIARLKSERKVRRASDAPDEAASNGG